MAPTLPTPRFVYGTAWKEDATSALVLMALRAGFRAVDTANQRKHYHEAAVGQALAEAMASGLARRDELWLQTKFTFRAGQDHRLPYDASAPIATQVRQSFESSLKHLGVERLDSYVLHGPSRRFGLHDDDHEAWRAMEALHDEGLTASIGVSNVDAAQLRELHDAARVKPAHVQNRCFAQLRWDAEIRALCRERSMTYQGFSLLTANVPVLRHPGVRRIAESRGCATTQVVFAFAAAVGMLPLTGTSDDAHARQDLAALDLRLTADELAVVEGAGE